MDFTAEHKTIESVEKAIRYARQQLMIADDKGESTQPYTDVIIVLKKQLAELKGVSQEPFSIKFDRMGTKENFWYNATARYKGNVKQDSIHKHYDGWWWCADCSEEFKTLKELKTRLTEIYKKSWGI
jgi:hypothetical protein